MFESRVNTLTVPIITTALAGQTPPSPATIIKNASHDCSIRVRNNSFGQFVLIAFDDALLQAVPARTGTFKLPAGAPETFVVAKGQSLYASTTSGPVDGHGAEISFHVYENLPVE
jgi:hypothetical protein